MTEPSEIAFLEPTEASDAQRLATAELAAFATTDANELRRRVVNIATQALMATPVGLQIDRYKLEALLYTSFETICDGSHVDVRLLVEALLRVAGVTEADLFIALLNMKTLLATIELEMELPPLSLDQAKRDELVAEAERANEQARSEHEHARRAPAGPQHRLRLGELLIAEGYVTAQEIAQALAFQERYGGKLGSNMVLLGLVTEEQLARFLSLQLHVPCCLSAREINATTPEAVAAVPKDLAARCKVVPLGIDKQRLRVAVEDPSDVAILEEIAFWTGFPVVPVVAPEVLIRYGLDRLYGVHRAPRLLKPQVVEVPIDAPVESAPIPEPQVAQADLPMTAPEPPMTLEATAQRAIDATEEAEVHQAMLDLVGGMSEVAALFSFDATTFTARAESSRGVVSPAFHDARLRLLAAGPLSFALEARRPLVGSFPAGDESAALAAVLGCTTSASLAVLPLIGVGRIDGFLVAAESRPDARPLAAGTCERLCGIVAAATLRIALRRQILDASGAA